MVDRYALEALCDKIGLTYGNTRTTADGRQFLSISCPLAPWNHTDPRDTNCGCSVSLSDVDPSRVKCWSASCGFNGSLYALIQRAVSLLPEQSEELLDIVRGVAKAEEPDLDLLGERLEDLIDAKMKDPSDGSNLLFSPAAREVLHAVAPKPFESAVRAALPFVRLYNSDVLREKVLERFSYEIPADYMKERGITAAGAAAWGLRFDTRLNRVVFPVRRFDGALVGLTGRILPGFDDRVSKYHNYSGLNKSRYLFGEQFLIPGEPVAVVEGQVDAVRTYQAVSDRTNVTAALGEGFSNAHTRTVASKQVSLAYLFTDNDPAGWNMAEKIAAQILDVGIPVRVVWAPLGKDPGDMTNEEIVEAFDRAEPISSSKDVKSLISRHGWLPPG